MTDAESIRAQVRPDTDERIVKISITKLKDDGDLAWVEEVIKYLTSSLPRRTRKMIRGMVPAIQEMKTATITVFFTLKGKWEEMFELDIRDALSRGGYQCA